MWNSFFAPQIYLSHLYSKAFNTLNRAYPIDFANLKEASIVVFADRLSFWNGILYIYILEI